MKNKELYEKSLVSELYGMERTEQNIKKLAEQLNIPLAKAYQIATFYDFPKGNETYYKVAKTGPLISETSSSLTDYPFYSVFEMAYKKGPEFVMQEVEKANLRGRGGAGFPAAKKWKSCRNAPGNEKYLIANGHNGDPGSNSDRYLMTHHCHQLIEGMVIAAYAIGATKGIIYVEGEFKDAIENLEKAIQEAYDSKYLGQNIIGSGFDFDIKIFEAAGVYVCGESTALMRAIEGKTGEPRIKHIHTAEKGVFDKPTVLNNVETLINIPYIIKDTGNRYSYTGSKTSNGTKVFSLVDITGTKIIETNMGTTLRNIIENYGETRGKLKGAQIGGPLGGFIPEELLDTKLCFDALAEVGAMMGDALLVIDEYDLVVDKTSYFTKFLENQSCGKCVSCKEGLRRINEILDDIKAGNAQEGDIELLTELAENAKESSLCQLGKSIYNPVSTAIKYFKEEFEK